MAHRTEQVRIVGYTSVDEMLLAKSLVLPRRETKNLFVPQKQSDSPSPSPGLGSKKNLVFFKNFEEV